MGNKSNSTISNDQISEFFERLVGPEGCNYRKNPEGEGYIRDCAGHRKKNEGKRHSLAKKIMTSMGIADDTQIEFLKECDNNGGHCDCEILMNVTYQFNKKGLWRKGYESPSVSL